MLRRIRNWIWKRRIQEAIAYLWFDGFFAVIGERERGIVEIRQKAEETEDRKHPLLDILIIAMDGKPVCELRRVGRNIYVDDKTPYIVRFNYGYWVKQVWALYQGEKKRKEAEEWIKQQALFADLEED